MYIFSIQKYILVSILIHFVIVLFIGVCISVDSHSARDTMFFNHKENEQFYQVEVVEQTLMYAKENEKKVVQNKEVLKIQPSLETQVDVKSNTAGVLREEVFITQNFSRLPMVLTHLKFKRTLEAQQNKFEGDSIVEISIDESGAVVNAVLKNDLPFGLNENSLKIAHQITFSPAQVAGENVKSKIIFRIKYRNEN